MREEELLHLNELSANKFLEKIVIALTVVMSLLFLFNSLFEEDATVRIIRYVVIAIIMISTVVSGIIYYKLSDTYFFAKKYILSIPFLCQVGAAGMLFPSALLMSALFAIVIYERYHDMKLMVRMAAVITIVVLACTYLTLWTGMLVDLNYITYPKNGVIHMLPDSVWIEDSMDIKNIPKIDIIRDYTVYMTAPFLLVYALSVATLYGLNRHGTKLFSKQAKLAQMEYELSTAANIQSSMLSTNFDTYGGQDRASIYASMHAAKMVGGDFYDFFKLDEEHVCIMIGDVSGKGMPASLFMVMAQNSLKNMAVLSLQPSEIMERVNSILYEKNERMLFVTVWLGILSLETGVLDFVNAGHNPPIIYQKDKGFSYLKCLPNKIIALLPNRKYVQEQIKLQPEDMIFLYTDGVTEAVNEAQIQFGEDRLIKFLERQKESDPKAIIESLNNELVEYQGKVEQFDDVTMLALKYIK